MPDGEVDIVKARILKTASKDVHAKGKINPWQYYGFQEDEIIDIELYPIGSSELEWFIGRVQARPGSEAVGMRAKIIHGEVELIAR